VSRADERDGRLVLARYKRLILLGKVSLSLEVARRIVGPDCAYHLYFRHGVADATGDDREPTRTLPRRRLRRRPK
jgi:hypothetical protein